MRVAYSCVVDDKPLIVYQADLWVNTLTKLAAQSPADLYVHVVDSAPSAVQARFKALGVNTRTVEPFDTAHLHSNKLTQLQTPELATYDVVVLCDCDVAFVEDIGDAISVDGIAGKIVDCAGVDEAQWNGIFAAAGFEPPRLSALATVDGRPTLPTYLNGGLLILPQAYYRVLGEVWPKWNRWMLDHSDLLHPLEFFTDQVSFALSLHELGLTPRNVGTSYNCPTHLEFPVDRLPGAAPKALHYHSHIDGNGLLKPTNDPAVNVSIDAVNALIKSERRNSFDNRVFWDFRYAVDAERGSGLGSRGDNLVIKRDLVKAQVRRLHPASVIDVGCGDLKIVSRLALPGYTGVDVSAQTVEQCKKIRPDWSFVAGSVTDINLAPADLVMCFDVTIHQPTIDAYNAFCGKLVDLANHHVIVAGYNQQPWHSSEITFYYEPLSATLLRLSPVSELTVIGGYRDTTVLLLSKPGAPPPLPLEAEAALRSGIGLDVKSLIRRVKRKLVG